MNDISAATGFSWIRRGFALLRKQPAELTSLFLAYMFLMLVVGMVPVFGQIVPLLLLPSVSSVFLQACEKVEANQRVFPSLLFGVARHPAFKRLLVLGVGYLLVGAIAFGLASLVDGGTLWHIFSGQLAIDSAQAKAAPLGAPLLVVALVGIPAAMAFWFAAPLVVCQGMGVGQALFYSFFSVKKSLATFVVYALGWLVVGILAPAFVSALLLMLTGQPLVSVIVIIPVSMVMTVAMYCSFYASYRDVFSRSEVVSGGEPEL